MATGVDTLISAEMEAAKGKWGEPRTSPPISASDIRKWAIATYWPDTPPAIYWDEDYARTTRWGGLVAPPDFNPFAWPVKRIAPTAQLQPAENPPVGASSRGRDAFMSSACALCHTIRGTDAAGTSGPDLTHLASRLSLAAGALDLSRGHLAAWIADPQGIKPGTNMPNVSLGSDELDPLVSYLAGLR